MFSRAYGRLRFPAPPVEFRMMVLPLTFCYRVGFPEVSGY